MAVAPPSMFHQAMPGTHNEEIVSICTCSPGRSSMSTCLTSLNESNTRSSCMTGPKSNDSRYLQRLATNDHQGGQAPGTLTLKLPVVKPDVAIPVIELHLV